MLYPRAYIVALLAVAMMSLTSPTLGAGENVRIVRRDGPDDLGLERNKEAARSDMHNRD